MSRFFIFCHGFGLTPSFWNPLLEYFEQESTFCLDLGYFGKKRLRHPNNKQEFEYIGIGHSLGFTKLIESGVRFRYLIGINAFVSFLGNDPLLRQRRQRELEIFKKGITSNTECALKSFYEQCGFLQHGGDDHDVSIKDIKKEKLLH